VNADCYAAWMIAIEGSVDGADLMDAAAYEKLLSTLDH
jgi:hypothetical protein